AAAVGEPRGRGPDGFANSEIEIMSRQLDGAGRHPDLEQPRVGIDKCCAPESRDDAGGGRVPQVEKQVRLGGSVQVQTALRDLVRNGTTDDRVQGERV